ncbi:hypothetical protein BDV29DRAFT_199912 [Aspergillus leporis]|uniref:STEEP1 domain-containing protein n=1 Tax=Aspergillus leporis TaxID=41062 RepID=A0A5N5XF60_9EURO|nr:hypothetical protein BDV29DRAFT_199912 [Aspergillus leporis]
MSTPTTPQPDPQSHPPQPTTTSKLRLPVLTHHCRFCNHLLIATTRDIASLPRRKEPAQDKSLILPLPSSSSLEEESDDEDNTSPEKSKSKIQKHYTILLSTTVPDRKATLVRREDGFEKRLFLRCGRCRVVVGYYLDGAHFPGTAGSVGVGDEGEGDGEREREEKVVYLLPGALMETGVMVDGDEGRLKGGDAEWRDWSSEI